MCQNPEGGKKRIIETIHKKHTEPLLSAASSLFRSLEYPSIYASFPSPNASTGISKPLIRQREATLQWPVYAKYPIPYHTHKKNRPFAKYCPSRLLSQTVPKEGKKETHITIASLLFPFLFIPVNGRPILPLQNKLEVRISIISQSSVLLVLASSLVPIDFGAV